MTATRTKPTWTAAVLAVVTMLLLVLAPPYTPAEAHTQSSGWVWSAKYGNSYIGSVAWVAHGTPKVGKGGTCERSAFSTGGCSNATNVVDYGSYIRVQRLYDGTWTTCQHKDYGWTGFSSGTYFTPDFSGDNSMMVVCEWGYRTVRSTHLARGKWNDGTVKTVWAYGPGHQKLN